MSCPTAISSGLLTTATQVYTGRGTLNAVHVQEGATATIYDSLDASGKILFQGTVAEAASDELYGFNTHVRCENGLHVTVTDGNCIVYFGG